MANRPENPAPSCSIEQYPALLQVSESISKHGDLTELLQDLAQGLPRILPLNFIGLVLHVPERNFMKDYILQANIPNDIQGGRNGQSKAILRA